MFEELFVRACKLDGLLALKNELSFRWLPQGRIMPLKSDLDFRLIDSLGEVAFVDTKSFDSDQFTFSDIDAKQLDRAVEYNQWEVRAGFCVWFRKPNVISFFLGTQVRSAGPRSVFNPPDGLQLGRFEQFHPARIYDDLVPPFSVLGLS